MKLLKMSHDISTLKIESIDNCLADVHGHCPTIRALRGILIGIRLPLRGIGNVVWDWRFIRPRDVER